MLRKNGRTDAFHWMVFACFLVPCALPSDDQSRTPLDPGVYLKTASGYISVEPEALIWRLGSYSASGERTSAHLGARLEGADSTLHVETPAEFLLVFPIYAPRQNQFRLLRGAAGKDRREFDLDLIWGDRSFVWSGNKKNSIPIETQDLRNSSFRAFVPALAEGEYGFFVSSFILDSGLPAEKVFTFRASPLRRTPDEAREFSVAGPSEQTGIYWDNRGQLTPLDREIFQWSLSLLSRLVAASRRMPPALDEDPVPGSQFENLAKWQRLSGSLTGKESKIAVTPSGAVRFIVVCPENTHATDYRLLKLYQKRTGREMRLDVLVFEDETYLGVGRIPLTPGPWPIPFTTTKLAGRTYRITTSDLKPGHYGFLAPATTIPNGGGPLYTFDIR